MSGRAAARAAAPAGTSARGKAGGRTTTSRPELRVVSSSSTGPAPRVRRAAPAPRSRRAPFVLLVVGMLVGTTLGLLFLNTAIAVDSLKATQLRTQNTERAQEVERLEQQVVASDAPGRLAEDAAAARLVPAGPAGYLVIAPDGTVTLRGTPAPATDPAAAPSGPGD